MEQLLEIYRGQTKEQLQGRQHTLEVQIENLEQDIKVWEGKTVTLSQKMTDYRAIKEKITRLQNISDSLFAAENNVNVGGQISPEGVTILQPATLAYLEPPAVAQHVIIAAALGLIAALAILLFVDRLDDRPNSLTEIVEHFDEAVLGQIPRVRVKNKADGVPILQEDDKRHAFREAYRNLRSSLIALGTSPQDHPRLILVTSAIPGDGKSLTVANLAITIAHAGLKVLLIDADMRRGVLHKRFNIGSTPGLAEVLNEQSPWSAAVVQGPVPTLHLLPRGASPKTPGELFMKPIREQFFKEAIAKYDYVLVDSPPVMAADDVSNLAPHVDGVLMVLRANYTSSRVARATLDLLYARKGHILGLVFNGVRPSGEDYYYYKYKKYYT